MSIIFDQIPADWRVPGVYIEAVPNYSTIGVQPIPTQILVIGQKRSTGKAVAGQLVRCTKKDDALAAFGAGSLLADMVGALRDANQTQDVYALALDDVEAGEAAKATITLSGSPTASAPLVLYIGGKRVRSGASLGDTPTIIASKLVSAINAAKLIVEASNAAGVVTLTVRHKGLFGNDLLAILGAGEEAPPAGLSVEVSAFTGGSANPELGEAFAAVGSEWFTDIVNPYMDAANLTALADELATRFGPMAPKDAHAYMGFAGTFGQASAKGATLNSPFESVAPADSSPTPPWIWGAVIAGVAAFHLTNDPARHLRTVALPGILPPPVEKRFTALEQDLLLRDGMSTWSVGPDGTVYLDRLITTYQTAPTGFDDPAWLDIIVPKTLTRVRYDWRTYLSLNYPRHKLAKDGSPAAANGGPVMTPRLMHGVWAGRCKLYAELGWLDEVEETVKNSVFEIDGSDRNRLNSRQQVRIIGQLMVIAGRLEFLV